MQDFLMRLPYQDMLMRSFLGNDILDYLKCLMSFVVLFLGVKLIRHFVLKRFHKHALKTASPLNDILADNIRKYLIPLLYYGAFYFSIQLLSLSPIITRVFNIVSLALLTVLGAIFVTSVLSFALTKYWSKKKKDTDSTHAIHFISLLVRIVIWAVALILFLDNLDVKISALVTGLGIGGIALAFAAQAVLQDFFSFFSIMFDRPFEIGDFIMVGEYMGTVEYIGIKTIRLRSISGEQLVFSNNDITNSRVRNYKRMEKRRVLFSIGVTYDTPLEKLKEIPGMMKEIIDGIPDTVFDRAHFSVFGNFSQNFEVVYYILSSDYAKFMDIQQEVNFQIRAAFDRRSIDFAFPSQTLYLQHEAAGVPNQNEAGKPGGGPVFL